MSPIIQFQVITPRNDSPSFYKQDSSIISIIEADGQISIVSSYGETTAVKTSCISLEMPQKDNCPPNTSWAQQRLTYWRPILTLKIATIGLLMCGLVLLGLGILVLVTSSRLKVYNYMYDGGPEVMAETQLVSKGTIEGGLRCQLKDVSEANSSSKDHTCFITVTLEEDVSVKAIVYYQLGPFYQNHRRFATSITSTQYTNEFQMGDIIDSCAPMVTTNSTRCIIGSCTTKMEDRALFPCGIIANTFFNDIFWLHNGTFPPGFERESLGNDDLTQTGIAREFGSNLRLTNPSDPEISTSDTYLPVWNNPKYSRIIPPPRSEGQAPWPSQINADYDNSTAWSTKAPGDGIENEHFRVWVDLSGHATFQKKYGTIAGPLPKGTNLTFAVQSNFYVHDWRGSKSLMIIELGWFGSKNTELGAFMIMLGTMCVMTGLYLMYLLIITSRVSGDMSALNWKHKLH